MNGISAPNVFVENFIGWMEIDEKKLNKKLVNFQKVKGRHHKTGKKDQ